MPMLVHVHAEMRCAFCGEDAADVWRPEVCLVSGSIHVDELGVDRATSPRHLTLALGAPGGGASSPH